MFQGTGFSAASTSSPFGQTAFGKPATGFNAPVFGSNAGTSLFGSPTTQQSGGLFGGSTATPAFGQAQTTQPTFGSFTSTPAVGTTGLFGAQTGTANTGGSLFGSNTTSAFGQAKPTTFGGFGTTGVGQTAAPAAQPGSSSLFGQPQAQSASGLFGAAPGFGAATGGTTVKFTPITGTDTMVKNGVTTNINTRHHCITCMKEYESKSLEELRLEDYAANRKGPRQGSQTGFGSTTGQMSLFGTGTSAPGTTSNLFGTATDNKSLLGSTTNTGFGTSGGTVFGTTSSNLFGKQAGTATAFGAPTSTTAGTFAFNTTANANLFGASTPQTGLFGATSQPSTGFGTGTTGFSGFGTTQPSLFGEQKPAFGLGSNTFNLPKPPVGTTTSTPLFSGQKTAPLGGGFGTTGFGQPATTSTAPTGFATPFGQQQQTGGLLGGASGGIKTPNTGFTFGQPTNTLGGNLSLGGGGSSIFGQQAQKPGGLFGATNMGSTGLFGGGGGGMNTFGTTMFNTGSNTLGGTGVGGATGLATGGGLSLGTLGGQLNQPNQLGSAAVPAQFVNPIQQQLNLYTTLPYGDSPIFKHVLKGSAGGKVDDLLKPSSPAAQKALLSGQNYKVSSKPTTKLKIKPIETNSLTKKSLFDDLYAEEEATNSGNNSELWPVVSTRRLLIKPTISLPGDTVVSPLVSALQKRASISNNHSPNVSNSSGKSIVPGNSSPVCDGPQLSPPLKHSTSFFNSTENQRSTASTTSTPQSNRNDSIGDVVSPVAPSSSCLQKKVLFKGGIDIDTTRANSNSLEVKSRESKENADQSTTSSSESDQDESVRTEYDSNSSCVGERHPTGITLRRVGYYTIPTMDELANLVDKQGRCIVANFTVGRLNYGNIFYPDSFDVAGLNLDEIVHFRHKEVTIYPNDATKPPVGEGLNRRAQVTLDRVWPVDKTTRLPITDPARILAMDYESKLTRASAKHGTHYVEYRPTTGSWVFKVDHFSKYGLTDSDEDDAVTDIKKIKLGVTGQTNGGTLGLLQSQQQQTQLHIPSKQVEEALTALMAEEDEDMDDDGITNPFDLDEELERRTLSPTAKLARQSGTNANKLQLMKASLFERTNVNIDGECLNFGDIVGDDDDGITDEELKLNSFKRFTDSLSWYHRQGAADILNMSQIADVTDNRICKDELLDRMEALTDRDERRSQDILLEDNFLKQQIDVAPKVFPYIRPKVYKLHYFGGGEVKPKHSIEQIDVNVATNYIADLGFFKKFSFRVGVGPCNQFTVLSTMLDHNSSTNISNQYPLASSDLGKISIISPIAPSSESESKFTFQEGIIRHLDAALAVSLLEKTDRGPKISPRLGTDGLEVHYSIAEDIASNIEDPHSVLSNRVFGLMYALWAELDGMKGCEIGGYDHACLMLRKAAVSDWLEAALSGSVTERAEINKGAGVVFAYMTGFKLAEACETAREMKDLQLSLLLSQTSGSWTTQQLIRRQLTQWRDTEADRHISLDRLKCYSLVAGLPVHKASQAFINTCEQMDWLTSFAIHFWYVTSASGTITDALLAYDESYKPNGYAVPPLPGYSNEYEILMSKSLKDNKEKSEQVYDILYHLLHLFSEKSYALEQFLYPATHTPDQLDYRIVWLVMRILTALGYSHLSENAASIIHSSFAIQLESHGLWEWAIFVLLHLKDDIRREHAVKIIIEKFVTLQEDCPKETFLIQRLAIPESWIYEAKATKAIYHKSYEDGARYLIKAGQWNKCHKLIAEHIASKAIINERYEFLEDLLNQLAERSHLISGWSGGGGGTILQYLTVVRKVDELVAARDPNALAYHLEEMQPQLTNLCRSIKLVPCKTPVDRLAQCEMSKRTADLLQNLILGSISEQDSDEEDATISGCVDALATLIAELPLASDYRLEQWLDVVNLWKRSIVCSKMKS